MKKLSILIILLISFAGVFAQKNVKLRINHKLGDEAFELDKASMNNIGTSFKVNRLQYYISEISVVHDGKETKVSDFWILENASMSKEHDLGKMEISTVDSIKFSIGVNKEVNHADPSQYSLGHPLAPQSPSMHWGWTAGYRFVAIEGKAGIDLNKTFEIHALGDQHYYNYSIPVKAKEENGEWVIELNADYAKAIANIDVSKNVITHGDFDEAITLLRNFWAHVFTSTDGAVNTLKINKVSMVLPDFTISPNPSNGYTTLRVSEELRDGQIRIYDLRGQLVMEQIMNQDLFLDLSDLKKGIYMVSLTNSRSRAVKTKRLLIQ